MNCMKMFACLIAIFLLSGGLATASVVSIQGKALNPKYTSRTASYLLDSNIKDESMFFL